MKRDLSKFRRRLGLKLIGAAFILLGFAGMLQLMIRPNIMNVCEYNSRAVTVEPYRRCDKRTAYRAWRGLPDTAPL